MRLGVGAVMKIGFCGVFVSGGCWVVDEIVGGVVIVITVLNTSSSSSPSSTS